MAMAATCARRALSQLTSSATRRTASLSSRRSSPSRLFSDSVLLSRAPVELGGAMSLMPLHDATSSALMTSLLCLSSRSWGCLSDGLATPL
ncbi:hypothetical protein MLD38_024290 [Melastoma candidum]|uniref:Uncharacterized protein n=1 Tax=Melastoma candidum TaxID=119954 RepID=A0ACB9NSQ3_9MYRT|nr:hypothetical protein MLD38_024290 [Melastoma candidum]